MEATIINTIVKNNKIEVGLPNSFNNHEVEVIIVMKENDSDIQSKIEHYASSHKVLQEDWDNELDNHWGKY